MSRKRERDGSSNSDLEELKYKYYDDLKLQKITIKGSGKFVVCPFCWDRYRKEYDFRDLLSHATRISKESKSATFRDKGRHLGLLRYLERYGADRREPQSYKASSEDKDYNSPSRIQVTEPFKSTKLDKDCSPKNHISQPGRSGIDRFSKGRSYQPARSTKVEVDCGINRNCFTNDDDEPIVWPWKAVVANIPVEYKNGRYTGDSCTRLKEEWVSQGYNPLKVHALWNIRGFSGFAIVDFSNDWSGFRNAMRFEKAFESDHHGKTDWNSTKPKGDKLYAWIARAEDYHSYGLIGKHLKAKGDLKSITEVQAESERQDMVLLRSLKTDLDVKGKQSEVIKKKISRTEVLVKRMIKQNEELSQSYNEEMERMEQVAYHQIQDVLQEHERFKLELVEQRDILKLQERELWEREVLDNTEKMKVDSEKRKLDDDKMMNEKAILQQKEVDETMMKLVEKQKTQKQQLHRKIIELESQLDQKQALQLEIGRMKGALDVMRHMSEEGDMETKQRMESIKEELKDKEEELESFEDLNQALIIKERKTNDELQDARKELIEGFKDRRKANIYVKRMGLLDEKSFTIAAKRKYSNKEVDVNAMMLCSLWQEHLRDPSWHPFKIIESGDKAVVMHVLSLSCIVISHYSNICLLISMPNEFKYITEVFPNR
ncbi:endoribonuclease [Lithospermum erythrorhizon]|uniref:Endoribonuclease n=1 Tax=Lithospermum erythrorhizon TaxID=34254 RepID=A0AAV3RIJ1_LITER